MPKQDSRRRQGSSASRSRHGRSRSRAKRRILRSSSSSSGTPGGRRSRSRAAEKERKSPREDRAGRKRSQARSESTRSRGKRKRSLDKEKKDQHKTKKNGQEKKREKKGDKVGEKGREKERKKEAVEPKKKEKEKDKRKQRKASEPRKEARGARRSSRSLQRAAAAKICAAQESPMPSVIPAEDKATSATTGSSSAGARSANGTAGAAVVKAPRAPLGNIAELQKGLEKERSMLQLFVLKAKQEHEEQKETKDKKERREKEYFKADFFGEPCGPKSQFILEDELGRGVFSTVYKCKDFGVSGKEYAIKFIRANPMLRKATEKEIRLMRRLRNEASAKDPEGARCFLALAGPESFEYKGHLALVFHLQRCDMRSGLQKYGQGYGLPLPLVRSYCRDLFQALRALAKVNVIHSDVKPDNLLMTLDKASVKLSDFGSAMAVDERIRTDYLQPRFYRAPEVILGQSYTTQVDVWSGGATIFELATGRFLFSGKTNNGMLHEMMKTCGAFSKRFSTTGDFAGKHFNSEGDFRLKDASGEQLLPMTAFKKPSQPLARLLVEVGRRPPPGVDAAAHQASLRQFADLIGRTTIPDPAERDTPDAILAHGFLQKGGGK